MKEELPIVSFRDQILGSIINNQVTIIQAETGAGKSTQVPRFLLEEGFSCLVTQPRRLAARTVAERVAYEYGCEFGTVVGYRTGEDRNCSPDTRCLFVTDGLALVRELVGTSNRRFDVLILDEVHEWNINIETLVAWVKHYIEEEKELRVVLMSATLEAEALSEFFEAQVIDVPGRLFEVEEQKPQGHEPIDDIVRLVREGRNVLVFEPGKPEIENTIRLVRDQVGTIAKVLPLHGELSPAEQKLCFGEYSMPVVVVATNVAQTSITIPGIDAVVDMGFERRIEVSGGVEGLCLRPISYADSKQRKGRAGRCKPGIYIDWCKAHPDDRREFPLPEIQRLRLDQTVLRLAEAGFDMEELTFFHQPPVKEIHEARLTLKALGCIDERGQITQLGSHIAHLPISVMGGKMLIEGHKRGVIADIIKIIAILEQGGITARPKKGVYEPWRMLVREQDSDILAQLSLYNHVYDKRLKADEMQKLGIFPKAFFNVRDMERKLFDIVRSRGHQVVSSGDRTQILKTILSGMVNHLYVSSGLDDFRQDVSDYRIEPRGRAKSSVVMGDCKFIVAFPFDLEVKGFCDSLVTIKLVQMITKVPLEWLKEVAPHLLVEKTESVKHLWLSRMRKLERVYFNGNVIIEKEIREPEPAPVVVRTPQAPQFGSLASAFDNVFGE